VLALGKSRAFMVWSRVYARISASVRRPKVKFAVLLGVLSLAETYNSKDCKKIEMLPKFRIAKELAKKKCI